jgi:hypothetical protein
MYMYPCLDWYGIPHPPVYPMRESDGDDEDDDDDETLTRAMEKLEMAHTETVEVSPPQNGPDYS